MIVIIVVIKTFPRELTEPSVFFGEALLALVGFDGGGNPGKSD